jgi:5-hydroxyisourate hydrolase
MSAQTSAHRSRITTHVLDATLGRPAAGVPARLDALRGETWETLAEGQTDDDGRIGQFGPADLDPGTYRVWFDVQSYFAEAGQTSFYPEVSISFSLADPGQHYHVPLLLSPYAYSTYRGS